MSKSQIVTPGEVITTETGFLRGHGTYIKDDGSTLVASVAGVVERVNKLVSVRPVRARYHGDVGDVVVGRVLTVDLKRWLVDVNSKHQAVLQLASVNLPGGVQRRKTQEDQLNMRSVFSENDLVSAEVHSHFSDGSMALHTRSLKYGKLEGGHLVEVHPSVIKRMKQHFHSLPNGINLIIANNGFIWVTPHPLPEAADPNTIDEDALKPPLPPVTPAQRLVMCRVSNAIKVLDHCCMGVGPISIMDVVEESESLQISPQRMLEEELMPDLIRYVFLPRHIERCSRKDPHNLQDDAINMTGGPS